MTITILNKVNKIKKEDKNKLNTNKDQTKAEWFINNNKRNLPYFSILGRTFDGITIELEGETKDEWCEDAINFIERNGFSCDAED